jgi:hypothetical protein
MMEKWMRLVPPRKLWLIAAAIAVTIGVACSDSTAPALSRRIAGTYTLTSDLQSYTYSRACRPTSYGTVCTDTTVAAGPSMLYGTFTLVDTSAGRAGDMGFTVSNASFHQADCALTNSYPCTESVAPYSGSATVTGDSLTFVAPLYGSLLVVMNGTVVGDEIQGQLDWHTYLGCCVHKYYSGTFVAKRQH